ICREMRPWHQMKSHELHASSFSRTTTVSLVRMAELSRQRILAAQTAASERNRPAPPAGHRGCLRQRPGHEPAEPNRLPCPRRLASALECGGGGHAAYAEQSADSTRAGPRPPVLLAPSPTALAMVHQGLGSGPGRNPAGQRAEV